MIPHSSLPSSPKARLSSASTMSYVAYWDWLYSLTRQSTDEAKFQRRFGGTRSQTGCRNRRGVKLWDSSDRTKRIFWRYWLVVILHICHMLLTISHPALIVLSALAVLIASLFAFRASRRWAAVGRAELRLLLVAFGVRSALQIVTMSSLLKQGSKGLVVVSAIHIGIIVVFFWLLLGNALIAAQIVEWVYKLSSVEGK